MKIGTVRIKTDLPLDLSSKDLSLGFRQTFDMRTTLDVYLLFLYCSTSGSAKLSILWRRKETTVPLFNEFNIISLTGATVVYINGA